MSGHEFTETDHEHGQPSYEQAIHDIGAVAVHETEERVDTIPEISAERQATFVEKNPDGTYYLFCGDDRNLTEESAAKLRQEGIEDPDTAMRYYGGVVGVARVLAVALAVQYGADALNQYPGSFQDLIKDQEQRIAATQNVKPGAHSAESNEGSATELNSSSESGIGCAYGAGAQVITEISSNPDLIALGKAEAPRLSGENESMVDAIAQANQAVAAHFSEGGKSFNLHRHDLEDLEAPIAILEGSHAPVDQTVVMYNYHVDKISNPRTANERGIPSYDNDLTQVAEALILANLELDLNPRILLDVMDQDIRSVREALASHEGKHAADLKIERYGDYEAAVAYLESIKATR
jgi:hypothetical protein